MKCWGEREGEVRPAKVNPFLLGERIEAGPGDAIEASIGLGEDEQLAVLDLAEAEVDPAGPDADEVKPGDPLPRDLSR